MPRTSRFGKHDKEVLALALPALGALAADPLVSLVDTAFVGRLGAEALGALGINTAIFTFAFIVFNFLAYATTPLVARAVGRGHLHEAGRLVVQALSLAFVLGLAMLLLLLLLAEPILMLMGAGEALFEPALTYLRIRALAGPALLFITVGHGAFRGYQDTRTPMAITFGLSAVNLVLDPLFIFGFGWGIAGAAWATVAAQWFGASLFLWFMLVARRERLGISLALPRPHELLPFLRIGGALTLRTLALIVTLTLATAVAARVGVLAVAAHQVAAQLWLFLALVIDALAVAAQALVARYMGAGEGARARALANRLLVWGLALGTLLGLGFFAASPVLPRLFSDDPDVIAAVLVVFPFVALMQPLNALVFVWDGIFMGLGDFGYLAKAMLLSALAAAALLLLVLPLGLGLQGVWWAIALLMAARALTLALRYSSADWDGPHADGV
jgi:putative MATE family efflux protein